MNSIIFSKDRAMQLDLLLCSMQKYAPELWPPIIIMAASDPDFEKGYQILKDSDLHLPMRALENWQGPAWLGSSNFKQDLLCAFHLTLTFGTSGPVCLLCDDDVFFRQMPSRISRGTGLTYSLRLGQNITWCYTANCPQCPGELDFAYPFSLDGNLYEQDDIKLRIEHKEFRNPNELEDRLNRETTFEMKWGKHSCLVSIPHNLVGQYPNRNMGGSAWMLNEKFLAGERIDLDAMDFSNVISPHQEIPYVFTKAATRPDRGREHSHTG